MHTRGKRYNTTINTVVTHCVVILPFLNTAKFVGRNEILVQVEWGADVKYSIIDIHLKHIIIDGSTYQLRNISYTNDIHFTGSVVGVTQRYALATTIN
jgi:hypothetical protein